MNVHDSEKMAGILKEEGYELTSDKKEADLVIMNTCSVREKAEQKFFSDLGRLKHAKDTQPHKKIVVTGCIAQQMGQEVIKRAPHVDLVIGPQNYHKLSLMLKGTEEGGAKSVQRIAIEPNPELKDMELPSLRTEGARAWVSIMYGCNNFCTYCIVPYTRGREQSRPAESIIKEVQELASSGFREITLLGQNVNSYDGGNTDFPGLLEQLNRVSGLERIRFVTSHPRDLSDALIDAIANLDKVCEQLHLPLQSGSTNVLRAMNRKYNYAEYKDKIDKLRAAVPGISITTDIIAGFPGETEEDHQMTVNALKEIEYDGIYAFRYSERSGTKATEMDGALPEEERLRRLREILDIQDDITFKKNQSLLDSIQEVLVEGSSDDDPLRVSGRTRTNKIVNLTSTSQLLPGDIIKVQIIKALKHSLEGELCE